MINEQIRCKEVRVIGEEGQQLGVMALRDALNMAKGTTPARSASPATGWK